MWTFLKKAKAFIFKALGREGKPVGKPQKLTPKAQERISTANLDRHAERLVALTKKLNSGKIDVARWQEGVKTDLRQAYIQNYILGRGGKGQLTKADYGSIGGMLKEQLTHLKKFSAELAIPGRVSPAQAMARIQMYARSAREAHERGKSRVHQEEKYAHWIVDASKENCPDCLEFQSWGWVERNKFKTTQGAGATRCKTNCCCSIEYK